MRLKIVKARNQIHEMTQQAVASVSFFQPLKTSETSGFLMFSRGIKKETSALKRLNTSRKN